MIERALQSLTNRMRSNKLVKLLVLFPFWMLIFRLGEYASYYLAGWPIRGWRTAVIFGVVSSIYYTFYPPGKTPTSSHAARKLV